jgi:hypothetical protein
MMGCDQHGHRLATLAGAMAMPSPSSVAAAHDALVGPDQTFLQHGLDGTIKGLQALIDIRDRMHP